MPRSFSSCEKDKEQRREVKRVLYSVDVDVWSYKFESEGQIQGLRTTGRAGERERERCVSGERASAAKHSERSPVDQSPTLSCYLSPSPLSTPPHIFFDSITKSPRVPVWEANQIFCIICWWQDWENFSRADNQTHISDIPESSRSLNTVSAEPPKPVCTHIQYTVYRYLNIYTEEISQRIWCNCESRPTFLKCMKLRVDFFLALYEKRNSSDVDYSTERISPSSRTRFMKQHAALISSTENCEGTAIFLQG